MVNTSKFTHPDPIYRDDIDSGILVPVENEVYSGFYDYEEIPTQQIDYNTYRLCSSPLLVRDLDLGDLVTADDNGTFLAIEKKSGKVGYRIAMEVHTDQGDDIVKFNKVMEAVKGLNCDVEPYSHQLMGIVVSGKWKARKVWRTLERMRKDGLIADIETNRA